MDCRQLREGVAMLLKNGHIIEFLSGCAKINYDMSQDAAEPSKPTTGSPPLTINMIFGGVKVNRVIFLAAKKMKISVTHGKRIQEAPKDDETTFIEEDVGSLILPHNNALVISVNVLDFKIKCVLVDPGSLANIIQLRVPEQAKMTECIVPAIQLLSGFNLTSVTTRREIVLPTYAEGVIKSTLFKVVNGDMDYNSW
ncbi:PREDICTED: uncharacterized protein LOC109226163 [Nicotiana attenuata]|uniref:uncharacterized protein LOC109226163 n=1 Tax=Nicotiana attenuata TaxID=49451 RepID=UPI00090570FA|nr:PREDICTED: uncharacterized protein LOC109226163 [Nicotiana attenuata]